MKSEKIKKVTQFTVKNARGVAAIVFVLLVGVAVYVDKNRVEDSVPQTYLYTSSQAGENLSAQSGEDSASDGTGIKILGEASLVDSVLPEESPVVPIDADKEQDAYFVSAVADRERKRDDALATLQTVVDSSEAMPDTKDTALTQMIKLAGDMEAEANIEAMVKAKGFEDCLAVISGESVSVVVKTSGLLTHEVAQIREIVMSQTGMTAESIKIIEKS